MISHSSKLKYWVFHHYAAIAIFFSIAVLTAEFTVKVEWQVFLGLFTGIFSFVYAVQKQKLEEVKMFKELFTHFNDRYAKLNGELTSILESKQDRDFTKIERDVLNDYFNLCGEEYLYYQQGFIYPEVWNAWYNGMLVYHKHPRIQLFWDKELKTASYYGFTFDSAPEHKMLEERSSCHQATGKLEERCVETQIEKDNITAKMKKTETLSS